MLPKHRRWVGSVMKCVQAPRAASPAGDEKEMCDDGVTQPEPPLAPAAGKDQQQEECVAAAAPCLLLGLPKDVLLCVVRASSCIAAWRGALRCACLSPSVVVYRAHRSAHRRRRYNTAGAAADAPPHLGRAHIARARNASHAQASFLLKTPRADAPDDADVDACGPPRGAKDLAALICVSRRLARELQQDIAAIAKYVRAPMRGVASVAVASVQSCSTTEQGS
jgi:hypothetical protein